MKTCKRHPDYLFINQPRNDRKYHDDCICDKIWLRKLEKDVKKANLARDTALSRLRVFNDKVWMASLSEVGG